MKKTNAVRILDQLGISYKLQDYEVDDNDLSAENVAAKIESPANCVFKTLVFEGDKTGILVAVIPGSYEVNLKKMAAASGNKKCWMIPMKNIRGLTGYIRGGVSPIGLKKNYPVFVDEHALQHQQIFVSAGVRGLQIQISPRDLQRATRADSGILSEPKTEIE